MRGTEAVGRFGPTGNTDFAQKTVNAHLTINSCKASTQQLIKDTDLIQLKEIQSSHNNVLHTMSDSDTQCHLWKPQLGNKSQSEYGSTGGDCALTSCSRGEHRDEEDHFMEEQLVLDQWAAPSNTSSVAGSSDRYTHTEDLKQLETNCPQIPPPLLPMAETIVSPCLVIDN